MRANLFVLVMLVVLIMAGCGGGGGSSSPAACVENSWSPDPATVEIGKSFVQTSNCGNTRAAVGTLDTWISRNGSSETVLFKSYSASVVRDIKTASDGTAGAVAFGRSSASSNNKGVLSRLDSSGHEHWRVQIDVPLGNTFVPQFVTSDGNHIAIITERLPLHDMYICAYDMSGNAVIGEININGPAPTSSDQSDWLLRSANIIIDGNNLVISRIQQSGNSSIFYASMIGGTPLAVAPLLNPEFVTVDSSGINVFGRGSHMKYARDLTVIQNSQPLTQLDTIHSVLTINDKTYVAGTLSGVLVLSELGNPAFRNTKNLVVGTDKVSLFTDDTGNLYVSVGARFGKLDKTTGEFATINPAAIPIASGFVSGNKYFSADGSNIESLDLSRVQ